MKTKILFILGFLIICIIGISLMVYLVQQYSSITSGNKSEPSAETQTPEETAEPQQEPAEVEQPILLIKDSFTLILPPGWQEVTQPGTWPIIIFNLREEVINEKAKEIDFQTNLSINRAELKEVLPQDYIESVKTGLIQTIPIIEIVKEEATEIDGREAHLVEIDSIQEDLSFKTLLVFVAKENMIWALSFNTLEESWPNYQKVFYQIAQSFQFN